MIDIQISPQMFVYDIRSMAQAFYKDQDILINCDVDNPYRKLKISFSEQKVVFTLYRKQDVLSSVTLNEEEGFNYFDDQDKCQKIKNDIKHILYEIFSADTKVELSWGTLTGMHPIKLISNMRDEGLCENDIRKRLGKEYFVSKKKADLSIEIEKNERSILNNVSYENGYSLYIGIPFCPSTCLYCSFTSYPISEYSNISESYLRALIKEINFLSGALKRKSPTAIYIGGGTPTTLSPGELDLLLDTICDSFDMGGVSEITVEAGRPDSITTEKLEVIKSYNVGRICINPQSLHQKTLDLIGRRHTVEMVWRAFDMARNVGFRNINMDFIAGLPGETEKMTEDTIKEALSHDPDAVTIHSLSIKRSSNLKENYGLYSNVPMENGEVLMNKLDGYTKNARMKPYYLYRQKYMVGGQENVGYAKSQKECLYNIISAGDYQNIWALGAGAVSKVIDKDSKKITHIDAVKNVEEYIKRVDDMIAKKAKYLIK